MKIQAGGDTIRQKDRQTQIKAGMKRETQIYKKTDKGTETEGHMETYRMIDWYTDKQAFTLTTRCSVSFI
jgi:hypothetical protein